MCNRERGWDLRNAFRWPSSHAPCSTLIQSFSLTSSLSIHQSWSLTTTAFPHVLVDFTTSLMHSQSQTFFTVLNVKFSHTRYQALGPELIPVYTQSGHRWLRLIGCHYFRPGLKNVTVLQQVPSCTAWWQRRIGVNNLLKVVTQLCLSWNWTRDPDRKLNTFYTTAPLSLFSTDIFVFVCPCLV